MAQDTGTLKGLQQIDIAIYAARKTVSDFDPQFEVVDEPVLRLESDTGTLEKRLDQIRTEERRLERAADDKRARTKTMEERLRSVRNLREEAAVHAEQDLLRRAMEADEREALGLLDQIRGAEKDLTALQEALSEAQAELEPKRAALLADRDEARARLAQLQDDRSAYASTVPEVALSVYDRIKDGGRRVVVADLTVDGACGHCFSLVPLQTQHEVRSGVELLRCGGCGVILGQPDPEPEVVTPVVEAAPVEAEAVEAPEEEDTEEEPAGEDSTDDGEDAASEEV